MLFIKKNGIVLSPDERKAMRPSELTSASCVCRVFAEAEPSTGDTGLSKAMSSVFCGSQMVWFI